MARRAFVPFVGFWLLACSLGVWVVAGWVPWLEPGDGSGLPWPAWVPVIVLWVAVYGAAARRWRDVGWPQWLLVLVWLSVGLPAGVPGLLVVCVVLAVVPREGWFDRLAEIELGRPRARVVVAGAGVRGAVVEEVASSTSAAVVGEPVDAPVLESVDEMRDWLYGDEG